MQPAAPLRRAYEIGVARDNLQSIMAAGAAVPAGRGRGAAPVAGRGAPFETILRTQTTTTGARGPTPVDAAPEFSVVGRVAELRDAIPANSRGRITMGVGVTQDGGGQRRVLIGTSEPNGYLRPGVTLRPGETMAPGSGHAEVDIVNFARGNNLQLLEIGATRPVCPSCVPVIEGSGARIVTPLKQQ